MGVVCKGGHVERAWAARMPAKIALDTDEHFSWFRGTTELLFMDEQA